MEMLDNMLTDEYSNYFLTAFITVFNRLADGERLNKYGFCNAVRNEADDNSYYFPNTFLEELFKQSELLISHEGEYLGLKSNAKIPYCMTAAEKIYLKGILSSRYAHILLDGSAISEILKCLEEVPDIGFDNIFSFSGIKRRECITDEEISNIRTVLKAIKENKALKYSNRARNGMVFTDKLCFPVRVEYSVMKDEFSASVLSAEENRPVRLLLSTLYDVELSDKVWDE